MNEVVIVSGCRTPIGKFLGGLTDVSAKELAITVGKEAIKRAGIPAHTIDEIVVGQVYQHGQGSMVCRQIGLACGLPIQSNACGVNQNCSSGMRALEIACNNIALGNTEIGLVIGVESMSNAPYMLFKARSGYRMNNEVLVDSLFHDALYDCMVGGVMGVTSENVAKIYNITREQCDELAVISHGRAVAASDARVFDREKIPVEVKIKKGTITFNTDEHMIRGATMENLGKLKPVFAPDGVGTAGNASGINDGACAAIVMSKKKAQELGLNPMLKMLTITACGVEPEIMGIGPAEAIPEGSKVSRYEV